MRYGKTLGLLVLATSAVMAIADGAPATILTTSTDGGATHAQLTTGTKNHIVNNGSVGMVESLSAVPVPRPSTATPHLRPRYENHSYNS
jgi:hypothetical protein